MIQELSVDLELFISGLTSNHSLLISLVCRHESLILSSLHPFLQIFLPRLPLSRPLVSGGIPQIDWKYWRCVAVGRRSQESMEPLSDSPPSGCLPKRASGRPRQPLPGPMVNGSLLPSLSRLVQVESSSLFGSILQLSVVSKATVLEVCTQNMCFVVRKRTLGKSDGPTLLLSNVLL